MEDVNQYSLDTRIISDTYIRPYGTPYLETGYVLAELLHKIGYTELILFANNNNTVFQVI